MSLLGFCQWLAETHWSVALHESLWVYPLVESTHVWALALFFGFAMILDLRLLGLALSQVPVSEVAKKLLPWTIAGFILMIVTGGLLFYAILVRTYQSIFFRVKVLMLIFNSVLGVPPSTIHDSVVPSSFVTSRWIQACGLTHSTFVTGPSKKTGRLGSNSAPKA